MKVFTCTGDQLIVLSSMTTRLSTCSINRLRSSHADDQQPELPPRLHSTLDRCPNGKHIPLAIPHRGYPVPLSQFCHTSSVMELSLPLLSFFFSFPFHLSLYSRENFPTSQLPRCFSPFQAWRITSTSVRSGREKRGISPSATRTLQAPLSSAATSLGAMRSRNISVSSAARNESCRPVAGWIGMVPTLSDEGTRKAMPMKWRVAVGGLKAMSSIV